jgi:hypothetical protein
MAKFSINIFGDKTNEKWTGDFEVKTSLSFRDELRRDQLKRELLGGLNPQFADPRAANIADVFSELWVRILVAPKWWTEKGNGIDLEDDNVAGAVYRLAMAKEQEALTELKEKAEKAREELRQASQNAG